jgi:hypothetical protein
MFYESRLWGQLGLLGDPSLSLCKLLGLAAFSTCPIGSNAEPEPAAGALAPQRLQPLCGLSSGGLKFTKGE